MDDKKSSAKWVWGIAIVVILIIILVTAFKTPTETGPIKIGWVGPLTGDGATIGQNAKDATEISLNEINSNGGINGRKVEVIYEDGKCNGKDSVNAANKLINIDKVSVIYGGACSGETLAMAPLAEKAKIPVLSYCSSAPSITNAGDYIFRMVPSDSYQGVFGADYIFNTLKKKSAAVLYQQTEWASGIREVFVNEFKKIGGSIVVDESFDKDARDFRTQLAKVKSANPDVIYFVSYAEPAIPALTQIKDMGIKSVLFGADAWSDPKIAKEAGKAAEGIMNTQLRSKANTEFLAKMKTKTGTDTVAECSAAAYDGLKILSQVIGGVGTKGDSIKDALYNIDYKGGVYLDEIKLDSNGDLVGASYVVKKVINGKAVELN
jgi:branched-chain amino acid transport system substrate-binding protein